MRGLAGTIRGVKTNRAIEVSALRKAQTPVGEQKPVEDHAQEAPRRSAGIEPRRYRPLLQQEDEEMS